jgi:hypothetical protein
MRLRGRPATRERFVIGDPSRVARVLAGQSVTARRAFTIPLP